MVPPPWTPTSFFSRWGSVKREEMGARSGVAAVGWAGGSGLAWGRDALGAS